MWEHAVKCDEIQSNRAGFIRILMEETIKIKPIDVVINQIMPFIKDILRHLENEEEE